MQLPRRCSSEDCTLGDGEEPPPGHQFMTCHMIVDVKLHGFKRKARLMVRGHMTEAPVLYWTIQVWCDLFKCGFKGVPGLLKQGLVSTSSHTSLMAFWSMMDISSALQKISLEKSHVSEVPKGSCQLILLQSLISSWSFSPSQLSYPGTGAF